MGAYALAQTGDSEALGALVRTHIPLVQKLCAHFSCGVRRDEVFQQGCMGLVQAIRRFDETRGTAFSTYAVPFILGEMRKTFVKDSPVTASWRVRKQLTLADRAREKLRNLLLREPTINEMAVQCGMDAGELVFLLERFQQPVYMEESFADLPDPHWAQWMEGFLLRDMVGRLPKGEQQLIFLRYTCMQSQAETAHTLRRTQSKVSREEKHVRDKLRHAWLFDD